MIREQTLELFEAITTNRAMRRYTDEPVTEEEITTCLRAAIQAPSGGNIQPWQFLVITDPQTKATVGEVYRRAYDRYEPAAVAATLPPRTPEDGATLARTRAASRYLADTIGQAPAMVAFLMPNIEMTMHDAEGPLDIGSTFASVYPAVQNFMLAARGLGIGTSLTTVYRVYHNEFRAVLGIPERYEVVALVPMGRPRGKFGVAPRRPLESVTHWNAFGNKRKA